MREWNVPGYAEVRALGSGASHPPHDWGLNSAMRKLSRLISVMRLITGIPVPKIHRRTVINRELETGEAGGMRHLVLGPHAGAVRRKRLPRDRNPSLTRLLAMLFSYLEHLRVRRT